MKKRELAILLCMLCAVCVGTGALASETGVWRGELHQTYTMDGVTLAELRADFPQIGRLNEEAHESVNAGIRTFIQAEGGFDVACNYALSDYLYQPDAFAAIEHYGVDAHADIVLNTGALLAVRYDFSFYAGGPHPWDETAAQHYDLATGLPVSLGVLVKDPAAFQKIVVGALLQSMASSDYFFFDEAPEYMAAWPLEQGLLTEQGLLVFYNEGEIGPVAAGAFELLIPYDRLTGQFIDGFWIGVTERG